MYNFKLQCPKCKSNNCSLIEEVIHSHKTDTRKNGWLKKRDVDEGAGGIHHHHFECNDCGYGLSPSEWENNDDFIIEQKEMEVDC